MKKYLLLAASALFGLAACENTEIDKPAPEPDEISVSFDNDEFDSKGGEAYVEVTSSGDWTLELKVEEGLTEDDYKWVEPSANAGSDGDMVIFEVKGNDSAEKDLEATFVFACGEATDEFTVRCLRKDAVPDKILLTLQEKTFEEVGGTVSTTVSSSGPWTLDINVAEGMTKEDYAWVQPSAWEGEDKDVVTFTVDSKDLTADSEAEFVFTVGTKSASFKVFFLAKKKAHLQLKSEPEVTYSYLKSLIDDEKGLRIELGTELERSALDVNVLPEGTDWLLIGPDMDNDNGIVRILFDVLENEGDATRTATVVISGDNADPVEVKVNQKAKSFITAGEDVNINQSAQEFAIAVAANVDYEVRIDESCTWLSEARRENGKVVFSAEASGEVERSVEILFVEMNPMEGTETASDNVVVTQKIEAVKRNVVNMTGGKVYPDNEIWAKPEVLNNLTTLTLEALVKLDEYGKSTIFGIEDNFYLYGLSGNLGVGYLSGYSASTFDGGSIGASEWYHVAVTVNENKELRMYVDGVEVAYQKDDELAPINFAIPSSETYGNYKFYIGYSDWYTDFKGCMSEVRVWNRCLSEEEISSGLHAYEVQPDAEGLVAYWKFDEGEGTVIHDCTANGNHLVAEGINWTEASLPE